MSADYPALLYLHGFNSSPASLKARQLIRLFANLGLSERLRVPAMHHDPRRAMGQLEAILGDMGRPTLMGSSLGGYYATFLAERYDLKAILLNPAVGANRLAKARLGTWQEYPNGERWEVTPEHLASLDGLQVAEPTASRYQVWLQTGDETLDYRDAEAYYQRSEMHILPGGDHGFQNFAQFLPEMLAFAGFDAALLGNFNLSDL